MGSAKRRVEEGSSMSPKRSLRSMEQGLGTNRSVRQWMEERIGDRGGRNCGKQKTKTEIRQAELSMSQDVSMKK